MAEAGLVEKQETKTENGIKNIEIKELEQPLAKAITEIFGDGRHYEMIIGDDTSGRIPTIIIAKVLNAWYESRNLKPAQIRFAYGRQAEKDISNIFEHSKPFPNRVLLATEHIETGEHIVSLGNALDTLGIAYDIVALRALRSEEYYRRELPDTFNQSTSFYGGESDIAPNIHNNPRLTGLRRGRVSSGRKVIRNRRDGYLKVAEARQGANFLANKLISRLIY